MRQLLVVCMLASGACGQESAKELAPKGAAAESAQAQGRVTRVEAFEFEGAEADALHAIGAMPAWTSVIERYRLLERREQSGAVHGLLIQQGNELRLVDQSLGQGSLSIAVELPMPLPRELRLPQRIVLWGAWTDIHDTDIHDTDIHDTGWIWRSTRAESLLKSGAVPELEPGLRARERAAPKILQLASAVSRRGGAISFVVFQREVKMGDGWLIADRPGSPPVARLLLPGEQVSYGGQSLVKEEERWQLRGNHTYWLEIGKTRTSSNGSLPIYRALTVPYHLRSDAQ